MQRQGILPNLWVRAGQAAWVPSLPPAMVLAGERRNGRRSGWARGRAEGDNPRRRRSLGSHRRWPQTLARRGTARRWARCRHRRQRDDGRDVGPARATGSCRAGRQSIAQGVAGRRRREKSEEQNRLTKYLLVRVFSAAKPRLAGRKRYYLSLFSCNRLVSFVPHVHVKH